MNCDAACHFLGTDLGVLHLNVNVVVCVPAVGEGIEEFELWVLRTALGIHAPELLVGKCNKGILVGHGGIGVTGQIVGVKPIVFDILAVVTLSIGKAKGSLLQPIILAIPQRKPKAQVLFVIAPPGEAILIPSICAVVGVVKGKVRPRVAIG